MNLKPLKKHAMRNCPWKSSASPENLGLVPTCPQCSPNPATRWQGGGRKRRKSKRKSKKRKSKKKKSRRKRLELAVEDKSK
jgi:hypothetical protein